MYIMNSYNALHPLLILYNALYINALSKALPQSILTSMTAIQWF